jgi:hypothetical protein
MVATQRANWIWKGCVEAAIESAKGARYASWMSYWREIMEIMIAPQQINRPGKT